jgi:hypothetical protein
MGKGQKRKGEMRKGELGKRPKNGKRRNGNTPCNTENLGHPRVTVTCQSDLALFALGLNLAKS